MHKIFEELLSVFHGLGWSAADFTRLQTVSLRSGVSKKKFGLCFINLESRPFMAVAMPRGFPAPLFDDLYSRYIDFNFDVYLALSHLEEASPETDYLLYLDNHQVYLYDVRSRECLVFCTSGKERHDRLYPLMEKSKVASGALDRLVRKGNDQLARELEGWVHIRSAELGSSTDARKSTLKRFMRKLILARYFRVLFGKASSRLLFEGFACDPEHIQAARHLASPLSFFKQLFAFFHDRFDVRFFTLTRAEASFLKKAQKETDLPWRFLSEFNLLARVKFSLETLLTAWCPHREILLSTKKIYTTSHFKISSLLATDKAMVIKPVLVDVKELGTPWALHLLDLAVQHWIDYNLYVEQGRDELQFKGWQMDMFGVWPSRMEPDGRIGNVLDHTLDVSFRVKGLENSAEKERFRFLIIAKCFEIQKKYELPAEPLSSLDNIFLPVIR